MSDNVLVDIARDLAAAAAAPRVESRTWLLEGDGVPAIEITGAGRDRTAFCNDCCEVVGLGDLGECLEQSVAHTVPGPRQCPELTGLAW